MFGVELEDLQDYRARHPLHALYFHSPQTDRLEAAKAHARKQHESWLASKNKGE